MKKEYDLEGVLQNIAYNVLMEAGYLEGTQIGLREWLRSDQIHKLTRIWAGYHSYTDDIRFFITIIEASIEAGIFKDKNKTVSSWTKHTWVLAEELLFTMALDYVAYVAKKRKDPLRTPWVEPTSNHCQLWFGKYTDEELPTFAFINTVHHVTHNRINAPMEYKDQSVLTVEREAKLVFQGYDVANPSPSIIDLSHGDRDCIQAYHIALPEYGTETSVLDMIKFCISQGYMEIVEPGNARAKALLSKL